MAIDSLVESITTYIKKPLITHVYVGPFALIYITWLFYWVFTLGVNEWWEIGCIITVVIILCHVIFLINKLFNIKLKMSYIN